MEKPLNNDWGEHFQTPQKVGLYMASLLSKDVKTILEPTKGMGGLVKILKDYGTVTAPDDFYKMKFKRFDAIVMNPPFSPMKEGYKILYKCMDMSDCVIALMPYLCIINGDKRTKDIRAFGLKSITHLPRTTFPKSRVQTCVLHLQKNYNGETIYKWL